jgi:DNA processing protein
MLLSGGKFYLQIRNKIDKMDKIEMRDDERNGRLDKIYAAALHLLLGLDFNALFDGILSRWGSFENFWKNGPGPASADLPLSSKARERLETGKRQLDPERLAERYRQKNIRFITKLESEFSKCLLTICNVPCILYYHGQLSLLNALSLAVVGSRRPTPYGVTQCGRISAQLSGKGVCVVSGMAVGVDAAAHRGALGEKGSTIAVLGSGIDCVYPRQNQPLFQEICAHGLAVSEFPPGTSAQPWHFPIRNRIISGLSEGVLVVEAQARSGSLITVDHALEQGREVFALPGPVSSALSVGPHRLIQQGAKLAAGAHDILEEIGFPAEEAGRSAGDQRPSLSGDEKKLMRRIGYEPVHIDYLLERQDLGGALFAVLMELEWKGWIQSVPGNYYVRV